MGVALIGMSTELSVYIQCIRFIPFNKALARLMHSGELYRTQVVLAVMCFLSACVYSWPYPILPAGVTSHAATDLDLLNGVAYF